MKLAVLADIHANLTALQTVTAHLEAWKPDLVIVAGDIVNRGPRPLECVRFVQEKERTKGWLTVRGNHEDYVINYEQPETRPFSEVEFEIFRIAYWSYLQLDRDVSALKAMPFKHSLFTLDGQEARITHASMLGNADGIFPQTTDEELRLKLGNPPTLFCVGHTHFPMVRRLDDTLVVNVGSVGLPFDGDYRASYGQLTWRRNEWHVDIIRLDYDRHTTEQDFFETGFIPEGGPMAQLVLNELQTAQSRLYQWNLKYLEAVMAGYLSIEEATRLFMADL